MMGNLFNALGQLVDIILTVMYWLILIRALISWVSPDPLNPIVQFLLRVTEPVLEPIRRLMPNLPIDLSPLIAFFMIIFLKGFLVNTLYDLAIRFH